MDLKVPIRIVDELDDDVIASTGLLDLGSGEITRVMYDHYDVDADGLPAHHEDYEFTVGTLSNDGKDVEFKVDVNSVTSQYSVSPTELLEIKVRAAALFAGMSAPDIVRHGGKGSGGPPPSGPGGHRIH
ncbi:MAG TPA: hypothetical protein VH328_17120 [Burkholderiaceae bacterium]|nr:hypothetical protein [Burkholderiaceae bacterium]